MVFYRFGIFRPAFADNVPTPWQFPLVVGIFLFYLLLRFFLNWQIELQNYSSKTFTAANNCFFNFHTASISTGEARFLRQLADL